ncbi:alpha/beta fold hydrolase [Lapillicoccus jejuensis]|uniref:Pimeloyl-ACP methyl ester carboxylesterase n=1 Tax=Lapillicoccus jejuensis TaxID=402171 RepID=A0A542E002_9MICO|nr:alpha/beta fold hydrolase [Lapillicoccus jejuensis]TQJ08663.1 pimeloyl-ACP methyl ester carboxylesterase [Lapillicoccus jejuensis]
MTTTSGYLELGDLRLYHEETGDGSPLVLVHGGVLDIEQSWRELVPVLAERHRVVALELQGHGRTNDIDRPITPAAMAGDVVALLDHLGIDRAHVLGHSLGGAVALELAVSHPDRVRSVVALSVTVRPDGMHEDLTDPARMATSTRMPTQEDFVGMRESYQRLSPHPEHFDEFLQSLSANQADLRGWSDEQLAGITAPLLHVMGDRDFTTVEHAGLMLRLIPGSRLAVLPDTTHMQVFRRTTLLDLLVRDFLDQRD